jgi:hypothetical protein
VESEKSNAAKNEKNKRNDHPTYQHFSHVTVYLYFFISFSTNSHSSSHDTQYGRAMTMMVDASMYTH